MPLSRQALMAMAVGKMQCGVNVRRICRRRAKNAFKCNQVSAKILTYASRSAQSVEIAIQGVQKND